VWYRNKQTGVSWDVTGEDLLARIRADPKFEPNEPPDTSARLPTQAPGGNAETVLPADSGEQVKLPLATAPPGDRSTIEAPSQTPAPEVSSTDDADHQETNQLSPSPTGGANKSARKGRR